MPDLELVAGTLIANRDLYWEVEKEFDALCERLLQSDEKVLTLDLSRIGFVFSPYVSRIVRLHVAAKQQGKSLRMLISPRLSELFQLSGLDSELNVELVEE